MGFSEASSQKELNVTPSTTSLLKKNIADIASGYRASTSSSSEDGSSTLNEQKKETTVESLDALRSLLSKFDGLDLDEKIDVVPDELKDVLILMFEHEVKVLEEEVEEKKEWAEKTALQAARKLCKDTMELNMLRMEKKNTSEHKVCNYKLSDATMKIIEEMEIAIGNSDDKLVRVIDTKMKLERENAEFRAEMEASKLSASESVTACSKLAKREKRSMKRQLDWEKQKLRFQEAIAVEKERNSEKEQQLVDIGVAQREAEVKSQQEKRAQDLGLSHVQEEYRLKGAAEANNRRKLQTLRQKTQIEFQRHKDDFQRLEEELSKLKASNNNVSMVKSEGSQREAMVRMYPEFDNLDVPIGRECLICMKAEVSVLFLPCAHQVLCRSCNNDYGNMGGTTCPCCHVPIERKILIFGTSSQ